MSVASEPLQNTPMGISLALNVLLVIGIVALLPSYKTGGSIARMRGDTPAIVDNSSFGETSKLRASGDRELPARLLSRALLAKDSGTSAPRVSSVGRRRN